MNLVAVPMRLAVHDKAAAACDANHEVPQSPCRRRAKKLCESFERNSRRQTVHVRTLAWKTVQCGSSSIMIWDSSEI